MSASGGWLADTLIDNLTVQEMLLYTAELKLEASVPLATKLQHVDSLVEQLALGVCRHVRIGNAMTRGISGQELQSMHASLMGPMVVTSIMRGPPSTCRRAG